MKKILLLLAITAVLFAKEDYTEMSTEELIAIIGYVKPENSKSFKKELEKRVPKMNDEEKQNYETNKSKLN